MPQMYFKLDDDEIVVLRCLMDYDLMKQKVVKYAKSHGHDLSNKPFEYNEETGEVTYAL